MNKKEVDPETLTTFKGIIKEFINDIHNSFPEFHETIDSDRLLSSFRNLNENDIESETKEMLEYCCDIYPSRFFDILYKNEDIFKNDELNAEINC